MMAPGPLEILLSILPLLLLLVGVGLLIWNSARQARALERIAAALEKQP